MRVTRIFLPLTDSDVTRTAAASKVRELSPAGHASAAAPGSAARAGHGTRG